MKQINKKMNFATIILDDGDTIDICKLKRNKIKIRIECINNTFHINEITHQNLKNLQLEYKEIKKMEKYLKSK